MIFLTNWTIEPLALFYSRSNSFFVDFAHYALTYVKFPMEFYDHCTRHSFRTCCTCLYYCYVFFCGFSILLHNSGCISLFELVLALFRPCLHLFASLVICLSTSSRNPLFCGSRSLAHQGDLAFLVNLPVQLFLI